jgi:diacylglycerol kinase
MNQAPAFKRETIEASLSLCHDSAEPAGLGASALRQGADEVPPRHSVARSFRFALDGFAYVLVTQRNFRIQLAVGAAAVVLGACLRLAPWEWVAIVGCATLVLVLEMLNTALESAIDLVTRDYHPLAKIAKDVAAGAVLLASAGAGFVGVIIFCPHLFQWWNGKL